MDNWKRITFTQRELVGDVNGFSAIAALYDLMFTTNVRETITIDLSCINWLDSNLCSPLGAMINQFGPNNCKLDIQSLKLIEHLRRNGFHDFIGEGQNFGMYDSAIKFKSFASYDEREITDYLQEQLLGKKLPNMSKGAKQHFVTSVVELFDNAFEHSQVVDNVCICGQYYPIKERLAITVTDLGIGITNSVRKGTGIDFTTKGAINWAIREGNSTRKDRGPNGFGLSYILAFLELNGGSLFILTNDGIWKKTGRFEAEFSELPVNFDGTVIHIEILTNDPKLYRLTSESRLER